MGMTMDEEEEWLNELKLNELHHQVNRFRRLLADIFSEYCYAGLFILKLHLLGDVLKVLGVLETLFLLDASSFGPYSVSVKEAYDQLREEAIHA